MDADTLLILKLVSDAGLLVLIWLVQLVIYPSFGFYSFSSLKKWHEVYTGRITLVVLPLMLSQLILSCWLVLIYNWGILHVINAVLVILTWLSTFITFVPLHQKIDLNNKNVKIYVKKLINYNWLRTCLWSIIFLLSLINMIY